jgi:hypothetical protein
MAAKFGPYVNGIKSRIGASEMKCMVRTGGCTRLDYIMAKAKLSLHLTKHHAMKTYRGSGVIAPRN